MKKHLLALLIPLLALAPIHLDAQTVTRGPYLQMGSTTATTVRWRTDTATSSVVRYGTAPGSLTLTASNSTAKTEHEIRLTGLSPNTKYYYSVGNTGGTLASGNDYFFVTAPTSGKPTRIWVLGDSGTGTINQFNVRDAYYNYTGTRHTDLWLMLGDNAYNDGTDQQYQDKLFNVYGDMLRKSVMWSTLGNHDGYSADSTTQTGPYYAIHTLPKLAEAGGVQSGTEAYYSFDYGNIHFVCLDSTDTGRSANGTMANWLKSDLQQNTKDWLIVFFHHPPYSKGSHDSDTEKALKEMRENFGPILESYGADIVLAGHSHSYERSRFIRGHFGVSDTFNINTMVVTPGSGAEPNPYQKPGLGPLADTGTVYFTAGSSGKLSGGPLDHEAMWISLNVLGSVVLDVDGHRLDALFIDDAGNIQDSFTMLKGTGGSSGTPVTVNFNGATTHDGWVLESTATSGVGGSKSSGGSKPRVGDDASNRQYVSVVSFDTASLPDDATITDATLQLKRDTISGTDPFTTHGALTASIRTGGFNGNASLENADFQAAATATNVATMSHPTTNGANTTGALNAAGRSAINKTGVTQFRLAFASGDNGDNGQDYMTFNASNDTVAKRPTLSVTYTQGGAAIAPPPPSGVSASAGNTQVVLNWASVTNTTHYNVKRATVNGGPYTTIASPTSPGYTDTGRTNGTTYYYVISAANAAGESGPSSQLIATPSSWTAADVGSVGVAGSYSLFSGVHTVKGSGSTISGTADSFHFAYQTITGDCTLTALVESQEDTHGYARAGVMIRDGLTPGAKHAFTTLTPGHGPRFLSRTSEGGSTGSGEASGGPAPYWVRVVRSGNNFSSYISSNGTTWTKVSSTKTISMSSTVQVGLAVCSFNNSTLGKAEFSNVTLTTP